MEKKQNRKRRARWGVALPFLRGSVHFFLLCILSSMLASLCELIIPRIIGFTVDSLLGGKELFLEKLDFLDLGLVMFL